MENNCGDHIHLSGLDHGAACGITEFVYPDSIPSSENMVPMSLVCSALAAILEWLSAPRDLNMVAARVFTVRTWLDPVEAEHKSLNEIADVCSVSRASLSKSLLSFRDRYEIRFTIGRLASSRAIFAQAQLASIAAGRRKKSSAFSVAN